MEDNNNQKQEPFRTFSTQEDFDNFSAHLIKKAEENFAKKNRAAIEAEVREQIENEAKLSGEQKLEAERQKFRDEMKAQKIILNQDVAKNLLSKNGFEEQEMDAFLKFVTEDKDSSIATIQAICDSRKSYTEKLHAKWTNEIKGSQPHIETGGGGQEDDLQSQYNKAKAIGNTAAMSVVIRNASAKGIELKQ